MANTRKTNDMLQPDQKGLPCVVNQRCGMASDKHMIVVIAGMYRSGSTFSFNIARESLVGAVDVLSDNSVTEAQVARSQGRNLLVKAHLPDSGLMAMIGDGRAACICTYRKPEEAVASWMDAFGFSFEESVNTIHDWLIWHSSFNVPVLNIAYETIEDRPIRAILLIQRYLIGHIDKQQARRLRLEYDKARVKKEYDSLSESDETVNIGISHYNATTFFHRRHVSSVSKREISKTLNSTQIANVRQQLGKYVDAEGMYTPSHPQRCIGGM